MKQEVIDAARDAALFNVLPPLVLAAIIMALTLLVAKRNQLGSILAFALAVGCGLWLRLLAPSIKEMWKGEQEWHELSSLAYDALLDAPTKFIPWARLVWLALAALWFGRLARLPQMQPTAGWMVRAAFSVAAAWLIIPDYVRANPEEAGWLTPGLAAVMLALWTLLERLAEESPGCGVACFIGLSFWAGGVVLLEGGIASSFEIALVLGAALIGMCLVTVFGRADVAGAMPAVAVLLPGLMLMGERNSTAGLGWYVYALPVFAPLLLVETLPLKDWPAWRVFCVRLALILLPLIAAVAIAHYQAPEAVDW